MRLEIVFELLDTEIAFCEKRIKEQEEYIVELSLRKISRERYVELLEIAEVVRIRFQDRLKELKREKELLS